MDEISNPVGKKDSFNLFDIKRQARRAGRRDSQGASRWNPFGLIQFDTPKRRNTANDAETGTLRPSDDGPGQLGHRSTAPDRLHTPIAEREGSRTSKDSEVPGSSGETQNTNPFASQVTTAENNSTNTTTNTNANGGLRNRRHGEADGTVGDEEPEKPKKKTGIFKDVKPKEGDPFTLKNQLQRTFLNSWINILILAAPAGIALNYVGADGKIVFAVNFIAIIPLAAMLSFATEEIALRTGETLGGLINATFGNAVELIVAVMALLKDEVPIVQTSLIGSILSNLLLVLGMCFFAGGVNRRVQFFNKTVAQTATSLLALAAASVIVPTVFRDVAQTETGQDVAALSRGTAVILLFVYGGYLFFQLKTHSKVYNETSQKADTVPMPWHKERDLGVLAKAGGQMGAVAQSGQGRNTHEDGTPVDLLNMQVVEEEEEEYPQLAFWVAVATLTISTVIIAFCAEFMVDGIQDITATGAISEEFIGLILLPIVGNAAEHATAVTVAIKDKMDLAIGVAVGSSMQVALFLIPLLVIIGWGIGNEKMTLAFDLFQITVMFVSVLLVNYLIADGESHWLEGMLLVCLYAIIAVCSFFYPTADTATAS
ncbi:Sodium/calcium exchanger protein-domain-containing protein [Pseudomassariella vexata]|uniref:Sodium/calcium exchanger protein-domain-containing protein n=1 Tax=Pseudomassariella vexata TaxID=1141098 RepID=A0A1Y2DZU2_9PEZI|nr:Sodium/calcium exchanger protein-domain-containing protein [Pseudomassariella vexata]ORY64803.1 Sodium/calcium exchanger protein-domain-containing protein [Pseudomassariella vexata]